MRFSARELVLLGVFGALWGAIEMSLGSFLHIMNVPMTGMFMSAAGLTIALIGRLFVNRLGATFFIGVIAALLKMFSIGGVVIWPVFGILMEALLADAVLTLLRQPNRIAFTLAGGVGVTWTLIHPFVSQGILVGRDIFVIWLDTLDEGARVLRIDPAIGLWLFLIMAATRFVVGVAAGWLAWNVGQSVLNRTGDTSTVRGTAGAPRQDVAQTSITKGL
jgi:hypothetical protein